ncbi:MAG: GNAT family N-acetyltransferase [Deltaproteobacteria bacterium]
MREIIEQGSIKSNTDLKEYKYQIRFVDKAYLQDVIELEQFVLDKLLDKDLFAPAPNGSYEEILNGRGILMGVFINDRLIGMSSVYYPDDDDDNIGKDVGLKNEEIYKVVYLCNAVIHPDFRGQGLINKLFSYLLDEVKNEGKWRYIIATASPRNYASIKNILSAGLKIIMVKVKFANYIRFIFYNDLENPISINQSSKIEVLNWDVEKQKELLEKGYVGFSQNKTEEGIKIIFGKLND